MHNVFAVVVVALAASGCAEAPLRYTVAAEVLAIPAQPKPQSCSFAVVATGPSAGTYDTLGTLAPAEFAARSQPELVDAIQAQVCKLGGEIVIAKPNTAGNYSDVVVLRRHATSEHDVPHQELAAHDRAGGPGLVFP